MELPLNSMLTLEAKANVERSQEKNLAAFFWPQEPGTKKHLHLKNQNFLPQAWIFSQY